MNSYADDILLFLQDSQNSLQEVCLKNFKLYPLLVYIKYSSYLCEVLLFIHLW